MSSADHETDSDELDPDEPRTPMWLPLLGGGLFLLALLLFLATRSDEEPTDEATAEIAAEQATAEQAPAADDPAAGDDDAPARAGNAPARPARAEPAARAERAPAAGAPAPRPAGDTRNRAPNDPHFGHDHD